MTLIGITVMIRQVRQQCKPPPVQLLKSGVELADPSKLRGHNTNVFFKQPLKGSFSDMQFLLHFLQVGL